MIVREVLEQNGFDVSKIQNSKLNLNKVRRGKEKLKGKLDVNNNFRSYSIEKWWRSKIIYTLFFIRMYFIRMLRLKYF